jgi:hypothetical protein
MKYILKAMFIALVITSSLSSAAAENVATDTLAADQRISLGLSATEKAEFLREMRQMLASIQGILTGIGEENPHLIAESARSSGNRMARATPDSIRQKLPQSFKDIGGPTHMMFEELAIRAETDDMDMLASFTGELMQQCLSCHAIYKTD